MLVFEADVSFLSIIYKSFLEESGWHLLNHERITISRRAKAQEKPVISPWIRLQ